MWVISKFTIYIWMLIFVTHRGRTSSTIWRNYMYLACKFVSIIICFPLGTEYWFDWISAKNTEASIQVPPNQSTRHIKVKRGNKEDPHLISNITKYNYIYNWKKTRHHTTTQLKHCQYGLINKQKWGVTSGVYSDVLYFCPSPRAIHSAYCACTDETHIWNTCL